MASTIIYKGSTIATVSGATSTLLTSGKYMEDNVTVVDVTATPSLIAKTFTSNGTYSAAADSADGYSEVTVDVDVASALTVLESADTNGGTIKNIIGVDISQDTVTASALMSGYTAHSSDGTAITGTASGGVDVPVFTLTWDSNYENITVTCNKTYAECLALCNNDYQYSAVCCELNDVDGYAFSYPATGQPIYNDPTYGDGVEYIAPQEKGYGSYLDLTIWESNNITWHYPSEYNLTLNATTNGTYTPPNYKGSYTEVNVNVSPALISALATPSEVEQIILPNKVDQIDSVICNTTKESVGQTTFIDTLHTWSLIEGKTYHITSNPDAYLESSSRQYPIVIDCDFTYSSSDVTIPFTSEITTLTYIRIKDFGIRLITLNKYTTFDNSNLILNIYEIYDGLSSVSILAVPSSYVGSDVARKSSSDLTASDSIVIVPAGYYSAQASKAVAAGAAAVPTTAITANPTISINASGLITSSVSTSQTVAPTITAGYVSTGASGAMNVSGSSTLQLTTQAAATITPSESQQTAVASGKYTTGNVVVAAISANYVGSGVAKKSSADLTASSSTVTAPAGYYASAATKTVSAGTAGTPTATKGIVSNHQVSITPSVTNTTGYITGSTKTGTAVTVSASELVSGSETKTANGTYDVTNLASLVVAVPIVTYYTGSSAPSSSLGSDGDIYLKTS